MFAYGYTSHVATSTALYEAFRVQIVMTTFALVSCTLSLKILHPQNRKMFKDVRHLKGFGREN
jgi:hypothetical protein